MTISVLNPPGFISEAEWAEVLDALTRREFLAGGAALGALSLSLAACGNSNRPGDTAGATRPVRSVKGTITVPAHPKRVVCSDSNAAFDLLDLDLTAIGTLSGGGSWATPSQTNLYRSMGKVGTAGTPDVEAIAALRPDLIVGQNFDYALQLYPKLRRIAPTVLVDGNAGWWQVARDYATVVNRAATLGKVKANYRQHTQKVRAEHAGLLGRTRFYAVIGYGGTNNFALAPTGAAGKVLADAGARFGPLVSHATADNPYVPLSNELLGQQLAAAEVILASADPDGTIDPGTRALINQPTFQTLPAAKAGRIYPIPYLGLISYSEAAVVLDQFTAALDKLEGTNR